MKAHLKGVLIGFILTMSASPDAVVAQLPQDPPRKGREIPRPGPRVGVPDLICQIQTVAAAELVRGAAELPITVVVRNQGLFDVRRFKVSVEYKRRGFDQAFIADFQVAGQPNETYPWIESLAQGKSETIVGRLRFDPGARNEQVSIRALADSCVNEAGMPEWCRVRESDEHNNKSAPRLVALP